MKAAAFELSHPASLRAACGMIGEDARPLAGGQSLGPMLNLRLATPARLVSIGRLTELGGVEDAPDAVTIGAAVTHAMIADGRTPDIGDRFLSGIAERIAYRAVRNRGTIGGSLCHADPAADWPCALTALGAVALTVRADGSGRAIALGEFITGAFRTALESGELLRAVRIPRPSPDARWAMVKACRKPGEFAHAMAAVLVDGPRGIRTMVIGAAGGPPIVLADAAEAPERLAAAGLDAIAAHMQVVMLGRAMALAGA